MDIKILQSPFRNIELYSPEALAQSSWVKGTDIYTHLKETSFIDQCLTLQEGIDISHASPKPTCSDLDPAWQDWVYVVAILWKSVNPRPDATSPQVPVLCGNTKGSCEIAWLWVNDMWPSVYGSALQVI
jgi:hypothetical protein